MTDNEMIFCLIALIFGWLVSRQIGNGFSIGGIEEKFGTDMDDDTPISCSKPPLNLISSDSMSYLQNCQLIGITDMEDKCHQKYIPQNEQDSYLKCINKGYLKLLADGIVID